MSDNETLQSIDDSLKQLVTTLRRIEQMIMQSTRLQVHGGGPHQIPGNPTGGCRCFK